MKAIDTNVLVRFLVNDDAKQAQLVRNYFANAAQAREVFFVPALVVLETIWVLESAYDIGRDDLVSTLADLLLFPVLEFENRTVLQAVLSKARSNNNDLSDLLISESARHAGCGSTLTFDKKAAKTPGFELLG
jgi:predicted nucleic-acid-binding protein